MPLDRELFQLASKSIAAPEEEEERKRGELDLGLFSEAYKLVSERASRPPRKLTGAQQEELEIYQQEQKELAFAKNVLEGSKIPGLRALTEQVGANLVSLGARIGGQGEYADVANRYATRVEQAAREMDKRSFLPTWLSRQARGAGVSAGTMVPAGMVGGPYGAIAAASAEETNRAITEGRDAGKKGRELAEYAITQGVIEAVPAAVMQRLGLGGVESVFGKRTIAIGTKKGLKRAGASLLEELPEELVTEIGHNIASYLTDVDPNAVSKESLQQTIADTVGQTVITWGFAETPGVVRSAQAGKTQQITEEMASMAKDGKVPSRKTWRKWGLPGELGESRPQRKAFSQELARQLDLESQQGAPEAPTEPTEAPGAEVAQEPELVPEALQQPPDPLGQPPRAPEQVTAAQETAQVAPPILTPQEGDTPTIALNKKESNRLLEELGILKLEPPRVRRHAEVLAVVSASKADETILDTAAEVIGKHRPGTDFEHAAMVLKAAKLMNELESIQAKQAEAAAQGNTEEYNRLSAKIEGRMIGKYRQKGIMEDIELLARADDYAGTETARSLSIRNLRLSRENYDVVSVIRKLQIMKGPKGGAITHEEQLHAANASKGIRDSTKKLEQVKQTIQAEEEAAAKVEAQKALNALKPKKSVGKAIKERAAARRENVKARLKALGEVGRVNDITGVSAEGLYLIGQLGVSYIESGVGTLVELVEQLRSDLPDLNLTDYDIWQALIAKNPKVQAKLRTESQKKVAQFKSMSRMLIEIEDMANGIAKNKPVRTSNVTSEMKALRKKLAKARMEFYEADINKDRLTRALETANRLEDLIDTGQLRMKKTKKAAPEELAAIRERASQLRSILSIREHIDNINRQIETGKYDMPKKKVKKEIDPRLAEAQIELARKKKELREWIASTAPLTPKKFAKDVASLMKSMKATADVSFTLRQNLWQVFSHPILAAGVKQKVGIISKKLHGEKLGATEYFFPTLRAFFSEYTSEQIYDSIVNGPNGFLYAKHGLAILDVNSPNDRQTSEIFRSNIIERSKLPGLKQWGAVMRASERHAVAIGNLVRTSAFDQFLDNHPNATDEELSAWADFVNVSTGIGNMGRWAAVNDTLQTIFYSPKFAVSRVQTPYSLYKYWKLPRVRKQIAKDMVRVVSTGGMILTLAAFAGFDVEWRDPDDPDWGKIRSGNTRRDIFGGFLQPARWIARLAKRTYTQDWRGGGPVESLGRFASYKFAPIVTTPVELLTGKTAIGGKPTELVAPGIESLTGMEIGEGVSARLETFAKIPLPFVAEDVRDAWKEEGIPTGIETSIETAVGIGVATYEDSETATRRKIKNLKNRGQTAEAMQLKQEWNRKHPKKRIVKVN